MDKISESQAQEAMGDIERKLKAMGEIDPDIVRYLNGCNS